MAPRSLRARLLQPRALPLTYIQDEMIKQPDRQRFGCFFLGEGGARRGKSSFLEKRTKKLLFIGVSIRTLAFLNKSFCFFLADSSFGANISIETLVGPRPLGQQSAELLAWRCEVEGFVRPSIQAVRDDIEVRLIEARQRRAVRKILVQQGVGVFVRAAPPRRVRVCSPAPPAPRMMSPFQ